MVQTGSFGPKPCPTCGGKGFVDENAEPAKKSSERMGLFQILFISIIIGLIGYAVWTPAGGIAGLIAFFVIEIAQNP